MLLDLAADLNHLGDFGNTSGQVPRPEKHQLIRDVPGRPEPGDAMNSKRTWVSLES